MAWSRKYYLESAEIASFILQCEMQSESKISPFCFELLCFIFCFVVNQGN